MLDDLSSSYRAYQVTSLVASGISTLLGCTNIYGEDHTTTIVLTVCASVASLIAFTSTGMAKIKHLTERIGNISVYFSSVMDFISMIESELILPRKLRRNADELSKVLSTAYQKLLDDKPYITTREEKRARPPDAKEI